MPPHFPALPPPARVAQVASRTALASAPQLPHGIGPREVLAFLKGLEPLRCLRAPPEKFSRLAAYDVSVVAERTTEALSARCDKEEMNVLALDLTRDIVIGRRTVEEAP